MSTAARGAASVAAALCLSAAAAVSDHAHHAHHAHAPLSGDAARRVALGEAALARGAADDALAEFERAAAMQHAAEIELGIVRAQMQAGQYRRALAFAAHVAGAHTDQPAGAALYAWLLRAGGQRAVAQRVLDEALARSPDDTVLRETRAAFESPLPAARDELLHAPHRLAPAAWVAGDGADAGAAPGVAARVIATAVLVDEGRSALVSADAVAASAGAPSGPMRWWVRDGLGRTRAATLAPPDGSLGIAVLRLAAPLPGGARLETPLADPWAGSPGFVVDHARTDRADPQWPVLSLGFFGDQGIVAAGTPGGGVVFDAAGRWAGVVLPAHGAASAARWVPASALRREWPAWVAASPEGAAPRRIGADEAYERALPVVLQVIVEGGR